MTPVVYCNVFRIFRVINRVRRVDMTLLRAVSNVILAIVSHNHYLANEGGAKGRDTAS